MELNRFERVTMEAMKAACKAYPFHITMAELIVILSGELFVYDACQLIGEWRSKGFIKVDEDEDPKKSSIHFTVLDSMLSAANRVSDELHK